MAPKLPYKAAQVATQKFSQKVPAGEASDAAKALAKYWEPAGDDMTRAVASDAYSGYGLDVSPPVDPAIAKQWKEIESNLDLFRSEGDAASLEILNFSREDSQNLDQIPPMRGMSRPTAQQKWRAADVRDSRDMTSPSGYGEQLLGVAATVGAGALALGAGAANAEEFWTPERLAKFQAKSKDQKKQILEKLTEQEFQELKAKLKPAAPAPAAGKPVNYSQYMTPQGRASISTAVTRPGVNFEPSQSGLEGASLAEEINANLGAVPDDFNPVNAFKAAYGIAQPLLREGIKEPLTPLVTQAQTAIRESGFAKPVTDPALLLGGRPAETLAQNAMSLFVGSPNQYQTTAEMEQRATEVADSPLAAGLGKTAMAVGGGVPGALAAPFVDDMTAAGLAYEGTKEAAYLPLYLIDARSGAGAMERAAVGGGLSEALDPRPGSDIARGVAFTGALGAGFEAAGMVGGAVLDAVRAGQWVARQNLAGEVVARAGNAMELAVTPVREFKLVADAPSAGAPRAGAKASMFIVKPGDDGVLVAEKIVVTKDGQKLSAVVPLEQTPLQRAYNDALSKEGMNRSGDVKEAKGTPPGRTKARMKTPVMVAVEDLTKVPEELRSQVTVFNRFDKSLPEVGTPDTMARGLAEATPLKDPTATPQTFEVDSEHLPLNKLPDDDVMLSWPTAGGSREFRVVSRRDMQLMSLKNRPSHVLGINTPDGVRYVETSPVQKDVKKTSEGLEGITETIGRDQVYVQPFDAAEKIPTIEAGMVVKKSDTFDLTDGDLNRMLDARDQTLAAEALARVDAAEADAAAIAATIDPAVVVQTPTGPKIAVTSTNGQPGPQPMPPGPPQPQTPTPQTPVMATGNGGVVPPGGMITPATVGPPPPSGNFIGQGINLLRTGGPAVVDVFINPAARGARGQMTSKRRLVQPQNAGKVMILAATSASAAQATQAIESIAPRMLKAAQTRIAPWLDALPPLEQARFKRDVGEFLTNDRITVADLKRKWPQITASIEQHVSDLQLAAAIKQQRLIAGGFQERKVLPAPEGMQAFVDDLIDHEVYAARIYFAPLAEPGAMKKLLEQDANLHADLLNEIAKSEILPKRPVGTTPADVQVEAELILEKWLGNPENIIAERVGDSRTAHGQGAAAMHERRAGKLEVAAKTYAEWKTRVFAGKNATPTTQQEVIRQTMRFVKGNINRAALDSALNKAGFNLPPKDIAFLEAFQSEVGEQLKPWQKKALRHVTDPFTAAPFTTVRQDSLLVQMEAVNAARQAGGLRSLSELTQMGINPVYEGWHEVPLDRSRFGDWSGRQGEQAMFVAPEFWEGLSDSPKFVKDLQGFTAEMMSSKSALARGTAKSHFVAKTMMTIGSPGAWASNVYGGVTGTMKAGVSPVDLFANGSWKRAVDQWREFVARPNEMHVAGQRISGAEWMREGMKYGTVGADAFSKEMRPMAQAMLRTDVLGSVTGVTGLAGAYRKLVGAGQWVAERYSAIDSVFRHGTWLTLLKKGGVDLDTGKLLDRAAADRLINGSRFRQAVGPASTTATDLSKMSDEQIVETLKQAMAWRVRRSFSVPGQPGIATEGVAAVSNASLGMVGNMFARTAMEEARSYMMLPYRAATEPGVAGALLQWGAAAGAMGLAIQSMRRSSGLTDEDVNQSVQGLPTGVRSYSPQMMGLWKWDDNGRVALLDVGKLFEALRYTGGDFLGRPIADQGVQSPGQLGARTAYNILVGSALGSSPAREGVDSLARSAGLQIQPPYEVPEMLPGPIAFATKLAGYIGQGLPKQLAAAYGRAQDPAGAGVGEFVGPLTGGAVRVGGTPSQGSQNRAKEGWLATDPQRQKLLEKGARRTGDEERQQQLRDEKSRLMQEKGAFMSPEENQ